MSTSNSNPKILICDGEERIRESLKLVLEDRYELIITDDGVQCLECLQNSKDIGIVFMDIKRPQTDGLEILEQIKREYPNTKIIVITGYKSVETATEAVRLGASGYIVKPFKSDEVLTTVSKNLT